MNWQIVSTKLIILLFILVSVSEYSSEAQLQSSLRPVDIRECQNKVIFYRATSVLPWTVQPSAEDAGKGLGSLYSPLYDSKNQAYDIT